MLSGRRSLGKRFSGQFGLFCNTTLKASTDSHAAALISRMLHPRDESHG